MRVKRIVTAMMAGCAAVVISAVPGRAAQTPPEPQRAATDTVKPPDGLAAKCQAMMAGRDKMMTDMKAADQRLDDLVARMNTASGMEKMTGGERGVDAFKELQEDEADGVALGE